MKDYTYYECVGEQNAPMRIDRIVIRWKDDPHGDSSYLGEYSSKPAEHHIDRKERGDMGRNEYRYFNLGCGDPEYLEQDYKRAEQLNRGNWGFVGCVAEATVSYPIGNGSRRIERLHSGGLWGIESDSSKEYLKEIEQEQLRELQSHLEQFGIEWPAEALSVR